MIAWNYRNFLNSTFFLGIMLMNSALFASSVWAWSSDPTVNTPISVASDSQDEVHLSPNGEGGALLTWLDGRTFANDYDIYAQQINTKGAAQWIIDGAAVFKGSNYQYSSQIIADGSGGAFVTWYSLPGYDIYAQRLSSSGTVQWAEGGVAICTATDDQYTPKLVADGSGGTIVFWDDRRGARPALYAQRIDASGTIQWATNGVSVSQVPLNDSGIYQAVSDGSGGAVVTWHYYDGTDHRIYAQRINGNGIVQWGADGVVIAIHNKYQIKPVIVSDGSGGWIIAWEKTFTSADVDIIAQKIDDTGAVKWIANGATVADQPHLEEDPQITDDGAGGAIISWKDNRNGNADIYAQRINGSGIVQWGTVALCTATNDQEEHRIISDGNGGAIITWEDGRFVDDRDIYAQRVAADGTVMGTVNGMAICSATGNQGKPQIAYDGAGGAIIAWTDERGEPHSDVYAQRLYANNSLLAYSIGGNVAELRSGNSLVLQNNGGADLNVKANGDFTFLAALDDGANYNVTVLQQPNSPKQNCKISNNTGSVSGADVTDVEVRCGLFPWAMFLPSMTEGGK